MRRERPRSCRRQRRKRRSDDNRRSGKLNEETDHTNTNPDPSFVDEGIRVDFLGLRVKDCVLFLFSVNVSMADLLGVFWMSVSIN